MKTRRTPAQRNTTFEIVLLALCIKTATRLHFVHEAAVPISRSPLANAADGIGRSVFSAVGDFV